MATTPERPRIPEIDRAKGLAILLVVIGHVEGRTPLSGADWYGVAKQWIYLFHMPFFMFLSGFVMEYTYRPVTTLRGYVQFEHRKFLRLMPAFLAVSALIVFGKTVASHLMHVDNLPEGILIGFRDVLLHPAYSSASALWYIYVIFIYYLLFPIAIRISRGLSWPLVLIGTGAYVAHFSLTSILALDRVAEYAIFLMIGVIAARKFSIFTPWLDRFGSISLFLFLILSLSSDLLPYPKLVIGLASIPALLFLVKLPKIADSKTLLIWGRYVFSIYLFNTLFIGLVKGIGLKFVPWDGMNFIVFFPLLVASGMLLPIALKKWVFVRWPQLDRMTT